MLRKKEVVRVMSRKKLALFRHVFETGGWLLGDPIDADPRHVLDLHRRGFVEIECQPPHGVVAATLTPIGAETARAMWMPSIASAGDRST